jgi:hypothetical protein
MQKRLVIPLVALFAICSLTLNAADNEIEQLKQMIKAQNAKIEKLEKAQGASSTTAMVDKAVGSRGACYLAPDRPDITGVGLSFTGEYLYWKTNATQNTYAYLGDGLAGPSNLGKAQNIDTDWSSGFRLGMDYKLPYDGWNIGADYTYYRADGEDSVTVPVANFPGSVIFPANSFGPFGGGIFGPVGHARADAEFSFDRVNVEIGRNTKLSETLSVRFFGGASVLWFDAESEQSFYALGLPVAGLGEAYNKVEAEAMYFGIRAGLDAEMKLKHGFSLLGKAAGSLLTGELDTSTLSAADAGRDGVLTRPEVFGNTKNSSPRLVPGLELEAGVAWEKKLLDNLNLKLFLGYQFSDYIGAGERLDADLPLFAGINGSVNDRENNLMLHGLVFRVKLDF